MNPILATRLDNRETASVWRNSFGLEAIEPSASPADGQWWIAPVLCDLQVNGFSGVDFQSETCSLSELVHATRAMAGQGCGRFFPTLVTDRWDSLLDKLRRLARFRSEDDLLRRSWAGWHIEGPFLSPQPGYCGAHDPSKMESPSPQRIHELREVAGAVPVLLTLAPECPMALESIREAVRLGITVSAGHTNATARQLSEAFEAGARMFTHLGNAIPKDMDRHDNVVWRVLDHGGFRVTLIPDSIHVSPPLFRIVHRLQSEGLIAYITDAMSAAGSPPGRYRLGKHELEVGVDLVVREPGKPNFSGSALTPLEGVRRAAMMMRCGWQEAWEKFSNGPAGWMGVDLDFRPSLASEFCLLRTDGSNGILEVELYRNGKRLDVEVESQPRAKPLTLIRPEDRGM